MALSKERDTLRRRGGQASYPLAANAKVFAGAMIAIGTGTGYAAPATTAGTWSVVGAASASVDNTGGANGALQVPVDREGWFRYGNSGGGDTIALDDVGKLCYAVDDETVALTDGGAGARSVAGRIRDVDAQGVWIEFLA
jgi:hypothetical protein